MKQKPHKETPEEQLARLKPLVGDRILAGAVAIEGQHAFFEVWAYRKFNDVEMRIAFRHWEHGRDKRELIRGKTFRVISNSGLKLR